MKFGITSTRFKDIFDFYYLIYNENLDKDKLIKYIDILIFKDGNMREHTMEDISKRLSSILNNSRFQSRINTANNNWLEIPIQNVIDNALANNNYKIAFEMEENWYRQDDKLLGNKEFLVQDPDGYLLRFSEDLGQKQI